MIRTTSLFAILFCLCTSLLTGQTLKVIASASMIKDIAENVIGDLHPVEMIVPIGGDPHLHEPTPSDVRLVAAADLILVNGLTFEGWMNELIENSGSKAVVDIVTEGVNVLQSDTYDNSADPHAWMDAANGIIYAKNIANAISKLDAQNADKYKANLERYTAQLHDLDQKIIAEIKKIPEGQRILVTSHDAFQYFGRKYGLQLEAIQGVSTEAEAQTSDIIRVNKVIREKGVLAIFVESTINPKLMEQIAKDNDVRVGGSLYADSLGDEKSPAATYIDMLWYNTKTLVESLTRSTEDTSLRQNRNSDGGMNLSFLAFFGVLLFVILGAVIFFMNRKS